MNLSDKVDLSYTKEDFYREVIEKLDSLQMNRQAEQKPATNLRSPAQSIREKLMGSLRIKSK